MTFLKFLPCIAKVGMSRANLKPGEGAGMGSDPGATVSLLNPIPSGSSWLIAGSLEIRKINLFRFKKREWNSGETGSEFSVVCVKF